MVKMHLCNSNELTVLCICCDSARFMLSFILHPLHLNEEKEADKLPLPCDDGLDVIRNHDDKYQHQKPSTLFGQGHILRLNQVVQPSTGFVVL